MTLKLLITF